MLLIMVDGNTLQLSASTIAIEWYTDTVVVSLPLYDLGEINWGVRAHQARKS
jgi:hypothetical protein